LPTTSATISKANISNITGITADDKIYDGTTYANLNTDAAHFTNKFEGDQLTVATATGEFADHEIGHNKTVYITNLSLGGADAKNAISSAQDENKSYQEKRLFNLIQDQQIDLVVLARYMQILSTELCEQLSGRIINIHHSFLPSFKGAKPYWQAHQRGVKLIGATAHYVTSDLDEGPIIEQEVQRVNHAMDPDQLAAAGRDAECMALARAVRWHAEHRILLNGKSTIIF
jgi:folate-dependent phosphoribosylglycinamide formyltransferase PurN